MVGISELASPARFERAAFRLGGECSILLSYGDRVQGVLYPICGRLSIHESAACRKNSRDHPDPDDIG